MAVVFQHFISVPSGTRKLANMLQVRITLGHFLQLLLLMKLAILDHTSSSRLMKSTLIAKPHPNSGAGNHS